MTLLGEAGLKRLARINHANAAALAAELEKIDGIELLNTAFFNEFTIRVRGDGARVVDRLADKNVLGGVPVSRLIPGRSQYSDLVIVAATEINTDADRALYARTLKEVL
jgi:glycine dehydrogenase subunit 1